MSADFKIDRVYPLHLIEHTLYYSSVRVLHQSPDATYYRTPSNIRTMIPQYDL